MKIPWYALICIIFLTHFATGAFPFAILAFAMMAASTAMQVVGNVMQGQDTEDTARAQAAYDYNIKQNEAAIARNNAKWAEYRVEVERRKEADLQRKTKKEGIRQIASRRMAMGKGFSRGSGSMLADANAQYDELFYDLDILAQNADIVITGIEKERNEYLHNADISEYEGNVESSLMIDKGKKLKKANYAKAGTSLLVGGAKTAQAGMEL